MRNSFIKLIIIQIFSIILFLKKYESKNISYINNLYEISSENKPEDKVDEIGGEILGIIINLIYSNYTFIKEIYEREKLDKICSISIFEFLLDKRYLLSIIAKKLFGNGFTSYLLENENECIDDNDLYLLIAFNYSFSDIYKNIDDYNYQNILFIETLIRERDLCIWSNCTPSNIVLSHIFNYIKPDLENLFSLESINLEGINLKNNGTTLYEEEYTEHNDYKNILKGFFYPLMIVLFIGTLISFCMENKSEVDENENEEEKPIKSSRINSIGTDEECSDNLVFSISSTTNTNKRVYNLCSAFNIIKNSLLLSQIKEPLSNENSLIELSTIKLIIIFLILLSENTYIIIKYIYRGKCLLSFLEAISFIIIKIGTISYEYYKILCGTIFGFKFINYYKKENFNLKRFFTFIFKFMPNFLMFLIIHYLFQYHTVEIVSIIRGSVRNNYISKRMNDCYYCQQSLENIFNPLMIFKYNSTDYNIAQYDGCFRTTLFTITEFICFILIMLIMLLFLKLKNKFLEILFLIINIIILCCTYILTSETKDLKFYTVSRLFGLSALTAIPFLFFPLYYIGFNIGIIYYYIKHPSETQYELNKNKNNYILFEYCYKVSLFLKMINGIIKNFILFICIFLMILISSFYTILINHKDKIFFEFNSFAKFFYVYERILGGIFFSIFLAVYLSQDEENNFKIYLSSQFFIFVNKISFILFNIFFTTLRIFHGINILGIHLTVINVIRNSFSLYFISIFASIVFFIFIFAPIKWIFFFITNGLDYEQN